MKKGLKPSVNRLNDLFNRIAIFPFHPLLLSVFPVIFFYANNKEQVILSSTLNIIAFSFFATCLVFVVVNYFIKNKLKTALIVSLVVLIVGSHGQVNKLVGELYLNLGNLNLGTHDMLVMTWLLLVTSVSLLVLKTRKPLFNLTKVLNIISLILLVNPVYSSVQYEIFIRPYPNEDLPTIANLRSADIEKPDIYYLIFDRYGSEEVIKNLYNHDISNFLNFLKERGFYVAEHSKSNYPRTIHSLTSSLNMSYLDFLTQQTNGGSTADETIARPYLENNKVIQFLKSEGYKFFNVGSWWEATRTNSNADTNYVLSNTYLNLDLDEFTLKFLDTTLISPVVRKLTPPHLNLIANEYYSHRNNLIYQFHTMPAIVTLSGPKFVLAHFLIPHAPYVFGKDCEFLRESDVSKQSELEGYLNQLDCANIKITELVETILSKSEKLPVIILQADEGPHPIVNQVDPNKGWKAASVQSLREKFGILNAYLLPGTDHSSLYSSITPVNSFRIIFDTYFGTELGLLEDRSYIFEDSENVYKFIDVTQAVKTK